MSGTRRVVALFRKASYSPNQHRTNDTAILEETVARVVARGWTATRLDETEIESGAAIPPAELYLNMCQGARASEALQALEAKGVSILNPPSSVLGCHRHRLVPAMRAAEVPFPETVVILSEAKDLLWSGRDEQQILRLAEDDERIWLKRGDVHAERSEDVVCVAPNDLDTAIDAFRARGITRISLQRHVEGPVVKFYGTADARFFRFYDSSAGPNGPAPDVDVDRLRAVAFAAAKVVGLGIFGGDVVVRSPNEPILIDLNDWPSFAPFRDEAADHIADFAVARAQEHLRQKYSSSSPSITELAADLV